MAKKDSSPRLGRGLAALLGDKAPQLSRVSTPSPRNASSYQQTTLSIDLLAPSPFQPRKNMDSAKLAELADSIRSRGVLQPLLVRPDPQNNGHYQIIAGERRWRASQQAGLHEVPVHIKQLDDSDAMAAAMVENLQRSDLNPIEEAEGLQRLIDDYHLTQEELAGALGKSRSHLANTLRLLNLPEAVRQHLRDGLLSAGHARALLAHPDPVAAMKIVLEKGLSVRQTEVLAVQSQNAQAREKPQSAREADILKIEDDLSQRLGLKTKITFNGKKGSLKVNYDSLEQFETLLQLLKHGFQGKQI
ncbi:ParB/RepB/Spo0J family partition protein [Aristophania vespae]|uniref:ParB/RepB/Spo0J family partition protein n=1 Tax=Aristophania vespae TaxID=2697033 RepID=A0A6P1NC50_9PROT|nr:ParB/RepB/Spo0J family partition protein [Aristophania vespae]QHI96255.1 ParB/RepB/Spo0J family partition protein [Aristophania vespae]UMM64059.1 Chromosome-partitioning protein ParB [Aristophania vespae]